MLKTNIEAAREIAKQLRLRDIGGIVIIDFIDMHEQDHQQMVLDALRQALKKDRTKTTVVGMTGLGLIEMTRKKVRQGLSSVLNIDCPYCEGTGKILSAETVARNVEKEISRYVGDSIGNGLQVEVHPSVAAILMGHEGQNLTRIENAYNKKIVIRSSNEIKHNEIKIKEIDINTLVC
ncbi:MAG TPA: ribonuclease E/G [Clostridia bacterium]|nr:ribonuclease E/G [Clostridia bacterium]